MRRLGIVVTPDNKLRLGVVALVSSFLLYEFTSVLSATAPQRLTPSWVDDAIPLVPATVWIYLSFIFLFILAYVFERNCERLTRFLYAELTTCVVSAIVFVSWPTTFERPEIAGQAGLSLAALRLLWWVDAPVNCFPSLHVSTTLLPALILWGSRSRLRFPVVLWAAAIALSTMTTKQHHSFDVVGGALLAGFVYWLFFVRATVAEPPEGGGTCER